MALSGGRYMKTGSILRVLMIALLAVCGSASLFAEIKDGDIVTIKSGDYYLTANPGGAGKQSINNDPESIKKPVLYSLWQVNKTDNKGYTFTLLADPTKHLLFSTDDLHAVRTDGATHSVFTLDEGAVEYDNYIVGRLYYIITNGQNRYLQYSYDNTNSTYADFWRTSYNERNNESSTLTIEKWERVDDLGGLNGEFVNQGAQTLTENPVFGLAKSDTQETKIVDFLISRSPAESYYKGLKEGQKISIGTNNTGTNNSPINLNHIDFSWSSNQTTISGTNCRNYEDATSQNRDLLEIVSVEKIGDDNKRWRVTIKALGSSPMELKNNDRWADFTDNIVVRFRESGDANEMTYQETLSVSRRSFHRSELPRLSVSITPTSDIFSRAGETRNYTISCIHQHGVVISHMYGLVSENRSDWSENTYSIDPEPLSLSDARLTGTFALKSSVDETIVPWLTKGTVSNNILPVTAPANNTGQVRTARLEGTFTYKDGEDTHTAVVLVPLTQNAKDGQVKFYHQKGYANTEFGVNSSTKAQEQKVHTAEKTIYYLPNETITLTLPEKAFAGYQRWYDYKTDGDPQYNYVASDRTSWVRTPKGTGINPQIGNSYGIYNTGSIPYGEEGNNPTPTPQLKMWNYDKSDLAAACHTIACDVSNYEDYIIVTEGDQTVSITEPTLSYRQLWHFRPAEEMANKLDTCTGDKYLETHYYTAPTNTEIFLATNYHHSLADVTQNSYYYYNGGTITRIPANNCSWYRNNETNALPKSNSAKDFQIVSSTTTGEVIYYLRASVGGRKILNIAKFVVKYVDKTKYGPTTSTIISRDTIVSKYELLEEINFNYGASGLSGNNNQLYKPLPWLESTYGYYYPNGLDGLKYNVHSNRSGNNIPYYGEYMLVNSLDLDWAHQTNHGGAASGYVLYVDGTTEPGLVASISTDATVCSGQTMYCSMWLCHPSENRSNSDGNNNKNPETEYYNPIFRCNIQGRNKGESEWKDVGVYFAGELEWGTRGNNAQGGAWHQVNFPVLSENEDYDETRVSIYNFGQGGSGNDFMVDDICLYVSPLPLAAYHATTGCESYTHKETTSTVVVLRVDYGQLKEDQTDKFVYYEIYNETDNVTVELKEKVGDNYVSVYNKDDESQSSTKYGSLKIPKDRDGVEEATSITSFINGLVDTSRASRDGGDVSSITGKCFIQDSSSKKWFLYLVHVIPSANNVTGEDVNVYLDREDSYILRIAYDPGQLHNAACVFTTQLHATQDTYIQLRNEEVDSIRVPSCLGDLCANNHHFLDVKVQNTITPTAGGALKTIEALVHADWLEGYGFDDVFCDERAMTPEQKEEADAAFLSKYGYSRDSIENAIASMRNTSDDNLNRTVSNPKNLQVIDDQFTEDQRTLIRDLCNRGLLSLYHKTEMFYLGSLDTVRYWVYPVAEDAEVTVGTNTYTLTDCNEPKWVRLSSSYSEYAVNLSPIDKSDQTQQQRLDLPSIRLLEGTEQVVIPVKELTSKTNLYSTLSPKKDSVKFAYNAPIEHVLEYVDLSNNRIEIMDAPTSLEAGQEYLMRMAFYDENGNVYIAGNEDSCRVGYIYFYLTIVPNVVQWTGEETAVWGDDRNWKGVREDGTLMDIGFAPLPETSVIIRKLNDVSKPYPIVTTDDHYPMDVYHHPNVCDKIYFEAGAMIHNQHLLNYNQAFVDMLVPATAWNTLAPPMKGMYTGDLYIPHLKNDFSVNTNQESTDPFVVSSFKGQRNSYAPYAFWQSFYNKRVVTYHENYNTTSALSTNTASFAPTNSLGQELPVGSGFQVLAYGPTSSADEELIVRLPKPDTEYTYYNTDGTESGLTASVSHSSKLAFEPDDSGDMYITLTNAVASRDFMFGNPTMTNINMQKFLADNPDLEGTYYTMVNGTWGAENIFTQVGEVGMLAPMRSVLLKLKEEVAASTSLTVKLSISHLEGYSAPAQGIASRKQVANEETAEVQLMTIYAISPNGQARCVLAASDKAHNAYLSGEDALFISSGVEAEINDATATSPINMYTVSNQIPMMVDVRETIDSVPMSMLVHDSYRSRKVKFAFYLSLNWNKECYLYDALTDMSYRIYDGTRLELEMPVNHEVRYYIVGPDKSTDNNDDPNDDDITTSVDQIRPTQVQVWAYGRGHGELVVATNDIIKEVTVYDITGRIIARQALDLYYNTTSLTVPAGVCVVEATMRDNTKQYTQAIVK